MFFLESSHPDLRRSFSNSPLINKHIRNSLQVPSSPVHSTSSTDSVNSFENQPTGFLTTSIYNLKSLFFALDDIPEVDNNFDPFSSSAKEIKTDFFRRSIDWNNFFFFRISNISFSKAIELVGSQNFTDIYNYLHDQRQKQADDPTRTDDIILSGLGSLSSNTHACTLINELVLHECLNELNERTLT